MLVIRRDQIQAMEETRWEQYCRQVAEFFRNNTPELVEVMKPNELEQRVRFAVVDARNLQITSREALSIYVALALAAGPEFHRDIVVRDFLTCPGATPDAKVIRLSEHVLSNLQELMAGSSDPS
jgi:hypothetical protein